MADTVNVHQNITLPPLDSLDEHRIETFYDADLDELSIHFYGRDTPHSVDPVNDVLSTMNDLETDQIVGVVFNRFLKVVIQALPDSRIFLDDATILTGEHILSRSTAVSAHRSVGDRLLSSLRAMRSAWQEGSGDTERDQRRRVFDAIPSLCA